MRSAWHCVFNFFSISNRNIIVLRFILQFCVVFQTLTAVGMRCHILKNTSPYRNQFLKFLSRLCTLRVSAKISDTCLELITVVLSVYAARF